MAFSNHAVLVVLCIVWGIAVLMLLLAAISCWCCCLCSWGFRKGLFGFALVTVLVALLTTATMLNRVQELWSGTDAIIQSSFALARSRMMK